MSLDIKRGDHVRYPAHTHRLVAQVMAVADGYAMLRYPRCAPFIARVIELEYVYSGGGR